MLNKFEMVGIGLSIVFMALALYLIRIETTILGDNEKAQKAAVLDSKVVIVGEGEDINSEREEALLEATDAQGNLNKLVIDDIVIGTGAEVKSGDTVVVHYAGTLQTGEEFDNSKKRGEPFVFKVGQGMVIEGWEQGVVGMKVGGQRILVIPPELGYGEKGIGPIPPNSTLVFSIELLEIK